jgi:MFS family permease
LHGLAYTFFIWVGFVYVNEVAPQDIRGSAQGLYTVVLFGFGFFTGTQFTGIVMDKLKTPQGSFRWRQLFLVPCVMTLICLMAMAVRFRG